MEENENTIYLVTHNGKPHKDDVMSTALLVLLFKDYLKYDVKIIRTRDKTVELPKNSIIYDTLGGEFDHHFDDKRVVDGGRELSSLGKIWRGYKDLIIQVFELSETSWKDIDEELIRDVDISDTGCENRITGITTEFNIERHYLASLGKKNSEIFLMLLQAEKTKWYKIIKMYRGIDRSRLYFEHLEKISKKIKVNGKIGLLSNEKLNFTKNLVDVDFVIYPSEGEEGGFILRTNGIKVPGPNPTTTKIKKLKELRNIIA